MVYEVETRVYFNDYNECFNILPWIKDILTKKVEFKTIMYGSELFDAGYILRISKINVEGIGKVILGYKEKDCGQGFNIRKEVEEELFNDKVVSKILEEFYDVTKYVDIHNIDSTLVQLGYESFIVLTGINLVGIYEELDIELKLMKCNELKYPILLEIEKTAKTIEEAMKLEQDLNIFITKYNLHNRVVKLEPPYLLIRELD